MTVQALRRRIEDLAYREGQLTAQKFHGADWAAETASVLRCQRERAELELERLQAGTRTDSRQGGLFAGVTA